ncbi:MAG: TonB-dependent receptor [Cyclobacteriaceae bacterium]|nr:TonB-dependent receptor [Cyclobacteriaceae bacterium]
MQPQFLLSILIFITSFFYGTVQSQHLIKGKVSDALTKQPLPFGNVALLDPSDSSLLGGDITKENGRFSFSAAPGRYILQVAYVGYSTLHKNIHVKNKDLTLTGLRLRPSAEQLEEITVRGVSNAMEIDVDKRIFDVQNNIVAETGTALELLETLPSVQLDEEGNISMRGSGDILIYINGRPTNLMADDAESVLEQFPANAIAKVELITNPSARYDAAGVGGIINIVLKENKLQGFSGSVNAAAGTRHKYNAGVNLSYNTGSWNFFTNYNYQYRQTYFLGETLRNYRSDRVSPTLDQDFNSIDYRTSHLLRLGSEYSINNRGSIGAFINANYRPAVRNRTYNIRHLNAGLALDSMFVRDLRDENQSFNYEAGLNFSYDIDTTGQKIFATFTYSEDERERIETIDQIFLNDQLIEDPANLERQLFDRPYYNRQIIAQADYENPVGEKGKLEAGYRGTFSFRNRLQRFNDFNFELNEYILNDFFSNEFDFTENIHALYTIWQSKAGKLGYQAGLRAEYTGTLGYEYSLDQSFENNYFDLFPSLFLSYDLNDNTDLQVNYSRRINRPGSWSLNPVIMAQDPYNLRTGNPELNPEYTHSFELNLIKDWDQLLFTAGAYFQHSSNVMTRIVESFDENAVIMTWANANRRQTAGIEVVNQYNPLSWLDATFTANFFRSEIIGSNIGEGMDNATNSWNLNLMTNARIPKFITVQTQVFYRGPIVIPQGLIDPIFSMNIGFRKDILNNKGTLSLNISDVFNTRIFRIQTTTPNFEQTRMFNRETQIATLSFIYRFGGYKERRESRDRGSGNGGDDDMF